MDDRAFVICQVGDEGSTIRARADEVYEYVVTPVVETLGLAVMRSDRDPTPGQITSQIIRSLTSAKVVIADLSGQNANVYYELGVAHSFGLPVVVLVDSIGSLSFDTSHERVIELGTGGKLGVAEADNAKARLKAALEVVLADVYKPASLVTEAAGARSLQELAPDNPVVDELRSLRERVEFLIRRAAAPEEGGLPSDSSALFEFISELESKARVGAYELEDFVNRHALSGDMERAITKLVERTKPPKPAPDDDIPF